MLAPALHFRIVSGRETNRGPVSRSHELLPSPRIRRIPTNRWNDVARCPRGSSVFSNDALASRERGGGHVWTRRKLIFDGVRGFDYRVKTNRLYQWNLITPYDYHNRGFSNCFYQCDGIGNVCVCVDVELESSYQFYDYASFIFPLIGRKNYSQGEEEWISIIWTVWLCKCVYPPIVFVVNSCIEIGYWSQQAGILWIPRVSGNVQKGRR